METKRGRRRLEDLGEEGIIDLFRQAGASKPGAVPVGIGDDAALVRPPSGGRLLITTDLLAEGVHFTLPQTPPDALGYKLAAANVSDIGSMGGTPFCALLSLALPGKTAPLFVRSFSRGLRRGAAAFGFQLVGGDTTASGGGIFVSLVLLGTLAGRRPLKRSGAKPGDLLFVTGHLGASALGLAALTEGRRGALQTVIRRHLHPAPPHTLGAALGREGLASAAIDISDGLATDLQHLCRASGAGAKIRREKLPIRPSTRSAALLLGKDAAEEALSSGEEYELLFTVSPEKAEKVKKLARALKTRVTAVGTIVQGSQISSTSENGSATILSPTGWRHF